MSGGHLGEDLAAMAAGGAELDPATRTAHERHAAECAACARAIREVRRIDAVLSEAPALEPSAGFDVAMSARLDAIDAAEAASSPGFYARLRAFLTPPWLIAGAALAAAAVAAVVISTAAVDRRSSATPEAALLIGQGEILEVAENLDLLSDYEVVENLDVLDDLDLIASLEAEPG